MLGDLFGEEKVQSQIDLTTQAMISSMRTQVNRAQSMADEVDLPPLPRKKYIGLRNQGATCYLNSFYQTLFMMPSIKKEILELDVEELYGTGRQIFGYWGWIKFGVRRDSRRGILVREYVIICESIRI